MLEKKLDSKLVCCICFKTHPQTAECTEFDKQNIDVLIKLKDKLIHICKVCTPHNDKLLEKLEAKCKSKIKGKLEKFPEGPNQQMKLLQD